MAIQKTGFSTTMTFSLSSTLEVEIKEITPPGFEGGDAIDVTTMSNTAWRTMWPKTLKGLGEASLVVAYDPAAYTTLIAGLNVNQMFVVTFPDAETLTFWGAITSFTPNANSAAEGEQPTAAMTITPTNLNGALAETAPVIA